MRKAKGRESDSQYQREKEIDRELKTEEQSNGVRKQSRTRKMISQRVRERETTEIKREIDHWARERQRGERERDL